MAEAALQSNPSPAKLSYATSNSLGAMQAEAGVADFFANGTQFAEYPCPSGAAKHMGTPPFDFSICWTAEIANHLSAGNCTVVSIHEGPGHYRSRACGTQTAVNSSSASTGGATNNGSASTVEDFNGSSASTGEAANGSSTSAGAAGSSGAGSGGSGGPSEGPAASGLAQLADRLSLELELARAGCQVHLFVDMPEAEVEAATAAAAAAGQNDQKDGQPAGPLRQERLVVHRGTLRLADDPLQPLPAYSLDGLAAAFNGGQR